MQNVRIVYKLLLVSAILILISTVTNIYIFYNKQYLAQSSQLTDRTYQILREADAISMAMIDQETGFRALLVTGSTAHLDKYVSGFKHLNAAFEKIKRLTADNPVQQKRLDGIYAAAMEWRSEVADKGIQWMTSEATVERARDLERNGAGKKSMDGIRDLINPLRADEEARLVSSLKALDDAFDTVGWTIILASGLMIVVGTLSAVVLSRSIAKPITTIADRMREVAEGPLEADIPYIGRKDEVGIIANTLMSFRDSLQSAGRSRQDLDARERAERVVSERRSELAETFVNRMQTLAANFTRSSEEVSNAAKNLSMTAEETSKQVRSVATAAEAATNSVHSVAASTEEMTASVREIAGQVSMSNQVANSAAAEAARTETDVKALAEAASKIGEVVDLINNIAGQTNLLALNATIEAARAGEAGRGFAVVASEVKQLASQTAKATEEIGYKINEIQQATNRTVGSIDRIVSTISQIQNISTVIATAIEEQGAATNEISASTQLAARGTEGVTNNIDSVGRAAEMTGAASAQLMDLSGNLNSQAGHLQKEVSDFVTQIRAA